MEKQKPSIHVTNNNNKINGESKMKKEFNIGELVEGGFGLLHQDYGFGIIVQKKTFGSHATAYRVRWANWDRSTTWEPAKQLTLVAKNAKV